MKGCPNIQTSIKQERKNALLLTVLLCSFQMLHLDLHQEIIELSLDLRSVVKQCATECLRANPAMQNQRDLVAEKL